MDNQELRELVNPVFNTAKACVQLSAATGDEDAQHLLGALGFEPFGAQTTSKKVPEEMQEKVRKLFPAYTILIETRFQSMNRLIEHREDRAIVDLPCGYTSRGIRLSRQGRTYFGCDLPAVANVMGPAVESIIGKDEAIAYHAVDATNYESLEAALADDVRNLLVTTEGLLMYFDQSELEEVFSNIRRLLKERGGSWVITDRAYFLHDQEVVAATLNNDPQLTTMYATWTSRAAASAADVKFNDNVFFDSDDGKVGDFIGKMGFELREVCMADYLPEGLASLAGNPEADSAVRDAFRKMAFWELTVAGDAGAEPVDMKLPFKVVSEVKDGTFVASVQGRLDTITAPNLLAFFEAAREEHPVEAVSIECSRLDYVSSAGLRVLVMMRKSCQGGVTLVNPNEFIIEILEQTGFGAVLTIA